MGGKFFKNLKYSSIFSNCLLNSSLKQKIMKIRFTIKNCFMLLTIKNKIFLDYIFKLFSIVFICIVKNILKNIHINKIIKNKILYIKTIFKYFKIFFFF